VPLLARQAATHADAVLGLFPIAPQQKADMAAVDHDGRVRQIVIKSPQTHLRYAWIIAVWTQAFARFMHDFLASQPDALQATRDMAPFSTSVSLTILSKPSRSWRTRYSPAHCHQTASPTLPFVRNVEHYAAITRVRKRVAAHIT
jgi:hypothetical protein